MHRTAITMDMSPIPVDLTTLYKHINEDDYPSLVRYLQTVQFSQNLAVVEVEKICIEISTNIMNSGKHNIIENSSLISHIANIKCRHEKSHNIDKLVEAIIHNNSEDYLMMCGIFKEKGFYYDFHGVCNIVIKAWSDNKIEDFVWIRKLYETPLKVTHLVGTIIELLKYNNIDRVIDYIEYCGSDINTLHLNKKVYLNKFDWLEYMEAYECITDSEFDKICEYCKSQTRIEFFSRIVLIHRAAGYYEKDTHDDLFKDLYLESDSEFRSIVLSCALWDQNIAILRLISQMHIIVFDEENIGIVMEKLTMRLENVDKTILPTEYTDFIMEHTNFLEKISQLSEDNKLAMYPIARIIKKISKN